MPLDLKNDLPLIAMPAMLLVVEAIALLLSRPLQAAGVAALPYPPESIWNTVIFLAMLLVFTLFILILIRFGVKRVLSAIIALSLFFTFYYIFASLALATAGETDLAGLATIVLSVGATAVLYKYPEWYVIDTLGILLSAGVASIFGIAVGIIPALALLILLAVYDAISVYRTKHMITLAEGVLSLKAPILFVIPKRRDYSFVKEGLAIKGEQGEAKERGAFVIGMGDMIMPTILVVSANVFIQVAGWVVSPAALGAIAGSLVGLAVLLSYVKQGKPQAGLPPLNAGTIAGFLIGCALAGAWGWVPAL
ncbi:MAG TPA: presenilin family intramembrane aspartyl protease PSH [Methanomicrobiales archaeon]|nr:presenilin family intramembrane aspartyl protease PSH [Methanomicrobiales archaeon]